MKPSSLSVLAIALASTVLTALPASAQELQRGETVLERPRPEVEQLGVRAGSFLLLPRIETGLTYDSNVFATDRNTRDDFIAVVRPQLNVRSDFNNHAVNLRLSGEGGYHFEYSDENYTDYDAVLDGRFDYAREGSVGGLVFHRREHEGRGDPDYDPNFTTGIGSRAEPVTYNVSGGEVNVTQGFNRFRARLSALANYTDYSSVEVNGVGDVSQDFRNRWDYGTSLRLGYQVMQGLEGFVRGSYTWSRYDSSSYNRDSDGYEVVGGVSSDLGGLITGEVYAGYLAKNYDAATLEDFSGLALGGRVVWNVTQLTTVTGSLDRQVRESTFTRGGQVASSYNRTIFAIGADHELLRTLILNARLQYREDDFNGVDRTDDVYTASAGASYQVSRYLYLTGGYTYETRNSNLSGFDYDDHQIFLRIGAQM
ncbi:outer membrane beta-barrel protein [Azospirillum sp. SYSU D00513]|uniref:outer membrane beta-barrel protein n=1 Tax=Azospirillum sp. SYSU D00513 TaxID=2812561 RepID=UPI001A9592A2|nr:outer membrane beta-barrel protein [Azospirillum sp. SYSU D00513]